MTAGTQTLPLDDLGDLQVTFRLPAQFLHGPGWAIPDHGINPYQPHYHNESVRAAVEAIEHGLGDKFGYWLYQRAASSDPEPEAALAFHTFVVNLRKARR